MNTAFSTTALLSFYAFLDHRLLQVGGMFTNTESQLYKQGTDSVLGSAYDTYAAPFRSLVWDSSISGANQFTAISGFTFNTGSYTPSGGDQLYTSILFPQLPATGYGGPSLQVDLSFPAYITLPSGGALLSGNSVFFDDRDTLTAAVRFSGDGSGIYSDLTFTLDGGPSVILRGQYGLQMDYQNGRVILPAGTLAASTVVSGSYAMKEFNLYFANQLADRMVFSDKPYLNSRFNRALSGMPRAHEMTTPAIFISHVRSNNDEKAVGGLHKTKVRMRLDVWAENPAQLENALSLVVDAKDMCFPQITTAQWPLAPAGDIKSAPYSYEALRDSLYTPANLFSITRVRAAKGSDLTPIDQSILVGHVDLTLERDRRLR